MSSQKGNLSRTRPQKYQNKTAFKNDKYDRTPQTLALKSLTYEGLCQKCKSIIEWKVQYKKYKPLTKPSTCIKCNNKNVKKAYHKICQQCAQEANVCAKCNETKKIVVKLGPSEAEQREEDAATKFELMQLSERKRRTVLRFIEKGGTLEESSITAKADDDDDDDDFLDDCFRDCSDDKDENSENDEAEKDS